MTLGRLSVERADCSDVIASVHNYLGRRWGVGIYALLGAVISFAGLSSMGAHLAGAEWTALPLGERLAYCIRWGSPGVAILAPIGALVGYVHGSIVDYCLDYIEALPPPDTVAASPPSFDRNRDTCTTARGGKELS